MWLASTSGDVKLVDVTKLKLHEDDTHHMHNVDEDGFRYGYFSTCKMAREFAIELVDNVDIKTIISKWPYKSRDDFMEINKSRRFWERVKLVIGYEELKSNKMFTKIVADIDAMISTVSDRSSIIPSMSLNTHDSVVHHVFGFFVDSPADVDFLQASGVSILGIFHGSDERMNHFLQNTKSRHPSTVCSWYEGSTFVSSYISYNLKVI